MTAKFVLKYMGDDGEVFLPFWDEYAREIVGLLLTVAA